MKHEPLFTSSGPIPSPAALEANTVISIDWSNVMRNLEILEKLSPELARAWRTKILADAVRWAAAEGSS